VAHFLVTDKQHILSPGHAPVSDKPTAVTGRLKPERGKHQKSHQQQRK